MPNRGPKNEIRRVMDAGLGRVRVGASRRERGSRPKAEGEVPRRYGQVCRIGRESARERLCFGQSAVRYPHGRVFLDSRQSGGIGRRVNVGSVQLGVPNVHGHDRGADEHRDQQDGQD